MAISLFLPLRLHAHFYLCLTVIFVYNVFVYERFLLEIVYTSRLILNILNLGGRLCNLDCGSYMTEPMNNITTVSKSIHDGPKSNMSRIKEGDTSTKQNKTIHQNKKILRPFLGLLFYQRKYV